MRLSKSHRSNAPLRVIGERDVRSLLTYRQTEALTKKALADYSGEVIRHKVRTVQFADGNSGLLALMPAFSSRGRIFSTKLVSVFPGNARYGLDSHQAQILLHSARTGELLAIVDGRLITEMRTAAASAAATRALAPQGPHTLAILGTGVQARAHAFSLAPVLRPQRLLIWGRDRDKAARLARELATALSANVESAEDADAAVSTATVIVTATSAAQPLFSERALHPGLHINAVGACTPRARELPTAALQSAKVYVDSRAAARVEAGDLLIPFGERADEHILAEIGEVFLRRAPGRENSSDITVFKSLGIAAEDLAVAHWIYRQACQRGIGKQIVL